MHTLHMHTYTYIYNLHAYIHTYIHPNAHRFNYVDDSFDLTSKSAATHDDEDRRVDQRGSSGSFDRSL